MVTRYICKDCKEVFREGLQMGGEEEPAYFVCPVCGSDDIDPADTCKECGNTLAADEIIGGLCPLCEHDVQKYIDGIRSTMTPAQVEYYDWKYGNNE